MPRGAVCVGVWHGGCRTNCLLKKAAAVPHTHTHNRLKKAGFVPVSPQHFPCQARLARVLLGRPSALAAGCPRARARGGRASGAARRRRVCVARYLLSAHVARCCPGLPRDCVLWRSPVRRFFVVYFRYGVDVALFLH